MTSPNRFQGYLTDRRIVMLIRWWVAGAVYFFIGWGTRLGSQDSLIDFVMTLGVIIGLLNIFVVNPSLRMMFNLAPRGVLGQLSVAQRLSDYFVELLKSIFIVLLIALIYMGLNQLLIVLLSLPSDAVPLLGEPILFGIFYIFIFTLLATITGRIKQLMK